MSRRFTLTQAEALLPRVGRLIREAVALKAEYEQSEASLQSFARKVMTMGGMLVDRDRVRQSRARRESAAERLKTNLQRLQETGCVVKDLDIGLVDFPTTFQGNEVYLCWKMDEPGIRFWHGVQEGFGGRKPIDQNFLDQHSGDDSN
jgi:hypothetical protein